MDREILFRAKAINRDENISKRSHYKNGDWVYGLVTRLYDERFPSLPAEMTDINGISRIEVDYRTIGQYTGLTDKNEVKIFEGDIINIKGNPNYDGYKSINYNALVTFIDGAFCAIDAISEDECAVKRYNFYRREYEIEIIGNIFDNPELMNDN